MVRTKSVWSPIDRRRDGLRILASRFRGRRMPASRYDVWMPSLGPSEQLLRRWLAGRITWTNFVREYRRELFMDGPIDGRSRSIRNHGQKFTLRLLSRLAGTGPVTVMCHCGEDELQCHRHELARTIEQEGRRPPTTRSNRQRRRQTRTAAGRSRA
jgi:uncharacterized protein YeaO (DUF488 family)